jgi:hypothetical protein
VAILSRHLRVSAAKTAGPSTAKLTPKRSQRNDERQRKQKRKRPIQRHQPLRQLAKPIRDPNCRCGHMNFLSADPT